MISLALSLFSQPNLFILMSENRKFACFVIWQMRPQQNFCCLILMYYVYVSNLASITAVLGEYSSHNKAFVRRITFLQLAAKNLLSKVRFVILLQGKS